MTVADPQNRTGPPHSSEPRPGARFQLDRPGTFPGTAAWRAIPALQARARSGGPAQAEVPRDPRSSRPGPHPEHSTRLPQPAGYRASLGKSPRPRPRKRPSDSCAAPSELSRKPVHALLLSVAHKGCRSWALPTVGLLPSRGEMKDRQLPQVPASLRRLRQAQAAPAEPLALLHHGHGIRAALKKAALAEALGASEPC